MNDSVLFLRESLPSHEDEYCGDREPLVRTTEPPNAVLSQSIMKKRAIDSSMAKILAYP